METEIKATSANFANNIAVIVVKSCSKALLVLRLGHGKSPCFSDVSFLSLVGPDCGHYFWVMLMEWKALNEQDKQDVEEISVQTSDTEREKPKNKRSDEEKIGD